MKKKITFTAALLLATLFVLGLKVELNNSENSMEPILEKQMTGYKPRENYRSQKKGGISQNSILKSSQTTYQKLDSIVLQSWNNTTTEWMALSKGEYTHDDSTEHSYNYSWNDTTDQWEPVDKKEFNYDTNGNLTHTFEYVRDEINNNWIDSHKGEYIYDANGNGNIVQYIDYYWEPASSQWVAFYKEGHSYDINGNVSYSFIYYWDPTTSEWFAPVQIDYAYDANGNMVQSYKYLWDETTIEWHAFFYADNTYDAYGNLTQYIDYNWDEASGEWIVVDYTTLYYSEESISSVSEIHDVELIVYPNPFTIYISFDISENPNTIILELYDVQGRKVISKEIVNNERVNMEDLDSGMYFYYLYIDGKKLDGKLIKR